MQVDQEAVAAALPAYEVGEELGRGSWGIVFAGRHRHLAREVAIKELSPALARDPAVRARFLAEGRLLASLDHPHVVPVYDFVEHEALCLLVMERLRGGTVADRAARERLAPQVACALALPACAGLDHAHRRGVLHRDVKPDNLLFSAAGTLKVADFGLAKVLGGGLGAATAQGEMLGTPAFMAPEQIQGRELTPATDVYALATTLYLLLSGGLPFVAEGDLAALLFRRAHEAPRPLLDAEPGLPARIAEVVDGALARDPAERPSGAEVLGVALARAAVEVWGPGWLAATGVVLASSGPIASAALGEAPPPAREPAPSIAGSAVETAPPGEQRPPAARDLERGREAYERRTWGEAFETLSTADRSAPLRAEDLERLATCAYMLGRNEDSMSTLGRAHQAYLEAGETLRAANCAFWIGMHHFVAGEHGIGGGWLARAQRLIEREGRECAEQGYMLLPAAFREAGGGNNAAAATLAGQAAAIGERFGDADLFALSLTNQGQFLVEGGSVKEGLRRLDEAMIAVMAGEVSPIVNGLVYCSLILGCQQAYDVSRAQQWTRVMTTWCDEQPDLVAFTGRCRLHRAELMQLRGAWPDALEEAERARRRSEQGHNPRSAGAAAYLRGEVHRLQGNLEAAEESYRDASRLGWEPQPGLALLWLARGEADAAAAALRRVLAEGPDPLQAARLLPAYVEVMVEIGDIEAARAALGRLEEIAAGHEAAMLAAIVGQTRAAIDLAAGDARAAVVSARRALAAWQDIGAPHDAARARVMIALACRALGDDHTASLELEAAREGFVQLGAAPDLERMDALTGPLPGKPD